MKKETCYCCTREVAPAYRVRVTSYVKKKIPFTKKYIVVSKPVKLYFCSKCVEAARALVRNNIAVKTSDIIDGQ